MLSQLVGRAKDIISRGGNKIAPLEIDNLLAEHPGHCRGALRRRCRTNASAKSSMPSSSRAPAPTWIPRELRDWLLARTERFKVPDVFHFRDALPSGASGKADRRAVAQLAAPPGNRR